MKKGKPVPWDESAVLIRTGSMEMGREIVAEGSLRHVVGVIAAADVLAREKFNISLPDRHVAPFSYSSDLFAWLMYETMMPA